LLPSRWDFRAPEAVWGWSWGRPADSNVYIGVETRAGGRYEALPFFAGAERGQTSTAGDEERKRYDVEGQSEDEQPEAQVAPFRFESITRDFASGQRYVAGG
jgi:hypothetical protein